MMWLLAVAVLALAAALLLLWWRLVQLQTVVMAHAEIINHLVTSLNGGGLGD